MLVLIQRVVHLSYNIKDPTMSPVAIGVAQIPNMKVTVFETQGSISDEAVEDLASALSSFFTSNTSIHAMHLTFVEQQSVSKEMNDESARNLRHASRKLDEMTGTEVIYSGTIESIGNALSSAQIVDMIVSASSENNDDLVSQVVSTNNTELSDVFVVLVEQDAGVAETDVPSSSPTSLSQSYLRNPDGIKGPVDDEEPERAGPLMITMVAVGVATLTMLIFILATRSRRTQDPTTFPVAPVGNKSSILRDLHDDVEMSIVSIEADWNQYGDTVVHRAHQDGSRSLEEDYEVEAGQTAWQGNAENGQLKSAAEINCAGTLTLEKEDNTVMPKSWLTALHGDNSSLISTNHERDYSIEASSADDTSTEEVSDKDRGGFPTYNNGAFPTKPAESPAERRMDWSHIGTVDEDEVSKSEHSAPPIRHALSQDTESKSSLNRFISDLVWLEQKIAGDNAKESIEVKLRGGNQASAGIHRSDSYSYECDEFSPRSFSDEESTITSITNSQSQAMSIVCRDCYIPPGKLDIDITSTKDGPVISGVGDKSLGGHLNVGDLIMALDDRDTRSLTAEQMAATLSARSDSQRKLTLLHFGGFRK